MEITREIAIKVRDTVDAGLVKGVGVQVPGQMCVEAAVCLRWACRTATSHRVFRPAIRQLKIQLNDSTWSRATRFAVLACDVSPSHSLVVLASLTTWTSFAALLR